MGKEGKEEWNEVTVKGWEGMVREKRSGKEARQLMRSEGLGRECLLADYQELRKIKRHTHSPILFLPPFLFHIHMEETGVVLQGVIQRILFGVKRNCLWREIEKAKERRDQERKGRRGEYNFTLP